MNRRVRLVSLVSVMIATVALTACSSGLSEASRAYPAGASNRQASTDRDVELCVAFRQLRPGETGKSVLLSGDPAKEVSEPLSLESDRCVIGPIAVSAEVVEPYIRITATDSTLVTWNIRIYCDANSSQTRYAVMMDWFETYKTSGLCSGETVTVYRKADSKGTPEYVVNIGF